MYGSVHCRYTATLAVYWSVHYTCSIRYTAGCSVRCPYTARTEHCSVQAVYTTDCSVHCKVQCTLHILTTHGHCMYTAGGTLQIHFSLCSVAAAYPAQSMQPTCSLHCRYTPLRSGYNGKLMVTSDHLIIEKYWSTVL